MTTDARYWMEQQAMERLAQHIPFEADPATKAELIEMLRGLALRVGRHVDREDFGFEARQELQRLGLWDRLGGRWRSETAPVGKTCLAQVSDTRRVSGCPCRRTLWRNASRREFIRPPRSRQR